MQGRSLIPEASCGSHAHGLSRAYQNDIVIGALITPSVSIFAKYTSLCVLDNNKRLRGEKEDRSNLPVCRTPDLHLPRAEVPQKCNPPAVGPVSEMTLASGKPVLEDQHPPDAVLRQKTTQINRAIMREEHDLRDDRVLQGRTALTNK